MSAGPMIFVTVSLKPVFETSKTCSGVGRSSTASGGRPTPSGYPPARAPGSTRAAASISRPMPPPSSSTCSPSGSRRKPRGPARGHLTAYAKRCIGGSMRGPLEPLGFAAARERVETEGWRSSNCATGWCRVVASSTTRRRSRASSGRRRHAAAGSRSWEPRCRGSPSWRSSAGGDRRLCVGVASWAGRAVGPPRGPICHRASACPGPGGRANDSHSGHPADGVAT